MVERTVNVKNEQVEVYNRKAKAKYTAVALSIVYLSTSTTLELIEFKEHYTQKALQLQCIDFAHSQMGIDLIGFSEEV